MKISCIDKEITSIFRENYYKIPRFQRPYSWDIQNVDEFWNDITDAGSDYFIGSIVVYTFDKKKSEYLGIVDGQQRLTTITMLLCAIRDLLKNEGFSKLADGIHRLIERPDIEDKTQYILQTETSYPFLQEHIQKFKSTDETPQIGEEEKQLYDCYKLLRGKLERIIESVKIDASVPDKNKQKVIESKLTEIRDKVLKLKLIYIILENEDDAYIIFETLNTRGKDLTVSDLVKNHITKHWRSRNRNVDRPKERWNAIRASFVASQADIKTNSFLHHYWLSRYNYVTEKKLFKDIKRAIKSSNVKDFLSALEKDAKTYRVIHEPSYRGWKIEEKGIEQALNALLLFRVKQQLPMIISILRDYSEGNLKLKHVREIMTTIENFHFIFTAVTSQRSSGGISFMYAKSARDLVHSKILQNKQIVLRNLKTKLKRILPSYPEFEVYFCEILASETFTKQKKLTRYILGKMTEYYLTGISLDMSRMTIEHIASQGSGGKLKSSYVDVARLGNLLLVDEKTNESLANKSFPNKKKILKRKNVWVDDYIYEQQNWGKKEILTHTKLLAKMAYFDVWKL